MPRYNFQIILTINDNKNIYPLLDYEYYNKALSIILDEIETHSRIHKQFSYYSASIGCGRS